MKIKRVISGITAFVTAGALVASPLGEDFQGFFTNKPFEVYAAESDIECTVVYDSADVFISEFLLNRAKNPEGEIIPSSYAAYETVSASYAYKDIAEAIIEDEWLLGCSVFWKNLGLALDGDFVSIATWKQEMYETILMDWLAYNFETDEFKSEFTEESAKYSWKIIKYLEKEGDIYDEKDLGSMSVEQAANVLDESFFKENEVLGDLEDLNSKISDVAEWAKTSYDYYKRLASVLAAQEACQSRIDFLLKVKSVSNDQDLCNAIDVVVSKFKMSLAEVTANEGGFIMLKHVCKSTWELISEGFKIPILKEVEIGKCATDWLFNNENIANTDLKITILYIINSDFTNAYTLIRDEYNANRTEYNAQKFNNAFLDYNTYQAYASSITKNEMAKSIYEGAFNQLRNYFDKERISTFEDLCQRFDTNISVSKSRNNLVGKWYNLYFKLYNNGHNLDWYYDDSIHVTGIHFDKKELELGTDDILNYLDAAVIEPANATNQLIYYVSSNNSVVEIKDDVYLSLDIKKPGVAVITAMAQDGGYQDKVTITVVEGHGKDGINLGEIKPVQDPLAVGDQFTIGSLTYEVTSKGEVEVHDCDSSAVSVTIPKYVSYNGYSYRVTSIGNSAFYECTSLTSITIPNSVTSIGDSAFYECTSLKSITIPDSVTSIGDGAFYECTSLTSITIPNSVTSIGDRAFSYCSDLTSIEVEANNEYYLSIDGVLFNKNKSQLIQYPAKITKTSYSIPDSITQINIGAFADNKNLTDVKIPDSVTSIGDLAFSGCTSLTSITIPDSVTSIGDDAFYNCTSLTSITIPNSVTSIGNYAFSCCTSLTSITIPNSVTSIGYGAFFRCTSLTSITIPNSVTSIGDWPFYECTSLTSITIPDSVTSIGDSAFYNCTSLTSITIPNSVTSIERDAFYNCTSLTSITIPNSVTSIEYWAFGNCTSLTSITIPNSVTSIGEEAFYGCTSLTSITIPDSVTSIGLGTFAGCESLTSITIPNSVTSIGSGTFKCCTSLTSITIPNSVTSIEHDVFYNCTSLTSITIPNSVTSIGYSAFENCTSLTSITIPNSVTSIEHDVFYNCTSLTSITIPNSVTSIGSYAFEDCTSLTSITIPDSVTSIGNDTFSNCTSLTSITIPDSVTSIGDDAFSSCTSLTSITIPNSVTSIGEDAFYGCTSLTSITIPDSVTSIGESAFSNCTSLTSITIPNSVTSIGDYAFKYCKSLTGITIPNSVTSIGNYAFSSCKSLTSITIPDSVTSIGGYAFSYCTSLTSITIPNSVTSIGWYAFLDCTSLTDVYYTGPKEDWGKISIGGSNGCLTYATIHYNYDPNHTHCYTSKVTKAATCTENGVMTFTCECGDTYTETIPATDHTYSTAWTIDKAATCTAAGSKSHHCTVCGAKTDVTAIAKTAHTYDSGKITKSATCTIDGVKTYTCTVCGATKTETIKATGHSYFTAWTIDKAATCTATGSKSHHCTVCGAKTDVTAIAKTAHTYDSGKITKAATCTTDGVKTYTCKVCGATKTETIKATGHTYSTAWTIDKAATCTSAGSKSHHCTVCGAKTDVTAIPKKSHTYKTTVVSPTYAAQGYTLHKCSICGTSYKDKYTAKKTVPTVTAKSTYTCTTNAVRINWNKVSGATGYKIYRYNPSTKKWTALKAIYDANTLTYKDSSLKAGTVYKYKVKAFVKSGGKFYFGNSCSTITTATKPTTATITKTAKSSTAVRLYWKKVTCTGYKIQRYNATTKKWVDVKTLSSGITNYRIANLKKNTSYKFRVCAYKNDGKKNLLGAWSYVTVKTTA